MRSQFDPKIERGRVREGHMASMSGDQCGAFSVQGPSGRLLHIIASNGLDPDPKLAGWEHVSVSLAGKYPPNWQEMCWVKNQFWTDEETVLQFHPRKSEYINIHPNCLHLWRNVGLDHPLPPPMLV
jgi:hypothetical protein